MLFRRLSFVRNSLPGTWWKVMGTLTLIAHLVWLDVSVKMIFRQKIISPNDEWTGPKNQNYVIHNNDLEMVYKCITHFTLDTLLLWLCLSNKEVPRASWKHLNFLSMSLSSICSFPPQERPIANNMSKSKTCYTQGTQNNISGCTAC